MLIGYVRVSARRPRRCPSCSQPAPSRQVRARNRHQRSLYEDLARIVAMAQFRCAGAEFYHGQRGRPSSKAFLNRSSAALKAGGGGGRAGRSASAVLISPIITFSASRLLLLGELSGRAAGSPVDGRRTAGRPEEPRRDPERRSRAAAARLLAALNSGP